MGRQPCCDKVGLKKGSWTMEEDRKLLNFIFNNGQCCWRAVPKLAGLLRCGKSCRLRWTNYLRPDLKRGLLSESEEKLIIHLHAQLGNRWSKIASHLPGRTDNEIKNRWNTHIKKKLKKLGIDPVTHKPLPPSQLNPKNNKAISMLVQQEQDQSTTAMNEIATDAFDSSTQNFSTDEVPIIETNEINIVPCSSSSTTSMSSTSSSSCSTISTSSTSPGTNEELSNFVPASVEWAEEPLMDMWGLDEFLNWDLSDCGASSPVESLIKNSLDLDSWNFEQF